MNIPPLGKNFNGVFSRDVYSQKQCQKDGSAVELLNCLIIS